MTKIDDPATVAEAVEQVLETAARDGSAAFALGAHHAATFTVRALGGQLPEGATTTVGDGRALPPVQERLGLRGAELPAPPAALPTEPPLLLEALRALFDAAVAAGLTLGSVEAAAEFTRRRPRPRPLPGVTAATGDPFGQTLLGEGLGEAWGAIALVRAAARELTELLADGGPTALGPPRVGAARDRALAALEVALTGALAQGDRIWQVVGTSGTANRLGFDATWRDARALADLNRRGERRRALGRAALTTA